MQRRLKPFEELGKSRRNGLFRDALTEIAAALRRLRPGQEVELMHGLLDSAQLKSWMGETKIPRKAHFPGSNPADIDEANFLKSTLARVKATLPRNLAHYQSLFLLGTSVRKYTSASLCSYLDIPHSLVDAARKNLAVSGLAPIHPSERAKFQRDRGGLQRKACLAKCAHTSWLWCMLAIV